MYRNAISAKRRLLIGAVALTLFGASADVQARGFETLLSFDGAAGGAAPFAGVVRDPATGNLYGTTNSGGDVDCQCGVVFQLAPDGTENVLHSFTLDGDGNFPYGMIRDKAGNLYGTTVLGGLNTYGTVFKVAPDGTETLLHSFDFASGAEPIAALVEDKSGNFYGTTEAGGSGSLGTVFKIAADGTFSVLYSFTGIANGDGEEPSAALIINSKGDLVGTTYLGGKHDNGTVFKVTPDGKETVLHSFKGSEGRHPNSGVVEDSRGNLFGTAADGGQFGSGTIYIIPSNGTPGAVYAFDGGMDGAHPVAGLLADSAEGYYGTTSAGGNPGCYDEGCGAVFYLTPDRTVIPLHTFKGKGDGGTPWGGRLIHDKSGHLYGTTIRGGAYGFGTVYRLHKYP